MPTSIKKFYLFILFMASGCFVFSQPSERIVIHFDLDKSEITASAAKTIDSLLQAKKASSIITKIELAGHCDTRGSKEYNDRLSLQRAESVKQYLVSHGMDNSMITMVKGFGEAQPLNAERTEDEMWMNRRVEITIQKQPVSVEIDQPVQVLKDTISLSNKIGDTATTVGTQIILKNLNFQPGRHYLVRESFPVIQELIQVMKNNPGLRIEIQGHICCINEYDGRDLDLGSYDLSVQRAKHVYEFLIADGIDASRLSYKGFGSSNKLYPRERDEFEQMQNRRVEIKILSK